jgi:hypothetical protein
MITPGTRETVFRMKNRPFFRTNGKIRPFEPPGIAVGMFLAKTRIKED